MPTVSSMEPESPPEGKVMCSNSDPHLDRDFSSLAA
jgi:hypothetical protein